MMRNSLFHSGGRKSQTAKEMFLCLDKTLKWLFETQVQNWIDATIQQEIGECQTYKNKQNSVALSPRANYTKHILEGKQCNTIYSLEFVSTVAGKEHFDFLSSASGHLYGRVVRIPGC
jgi:hypothetical protein